MTSSPLPGHAGRSTACRLALVAAALLTAVFVLAPEAPAAKKGKRGFLTIKAVKTGSAVAPVRLTMRVPGNAKLTVSVNGKRDDDDAFVGLDRNVRALELSVHNGLRYGANRIVVSARHPNGARDVARRTVRGPRGTHLADAGGDVSFRVGAGAIVGTRTGGLKHGDENRRLRWTVVSAPRGSKPLALRGARQARLRLGGLRTGTYVLRLSARNAGGGGRSQDTVTLNVVPKDPPIGVRFDTQRDGNNAIAVDGKVLPGTQVVGRYVSYALLDRETREPVKGESGNVKSGELDSLVGKARDNANHGRLMVITAQQGVDPADVPRVTALLRALDTQGTTLNNENAMREGAPFSFVGIVGGIAGSSRTLFPPTPYVKGTRGDIGGLLQRNVISEMYDLVRPAHPEFNTHAAGSTATKNVMTVGDATYAGDTLPPDALGGVQLVVLESSSLRLLRNQTFPLGTTPRDTDFWVTLRGAIDEPGRPLILLQTIGTPTPKTGEWDEMTRQIERLGGNRFLWLNLDGTNSYAFAGRREAERPIAESGSAQDTVTPEGVQRAAGTLAGVLTLTRTSSYEPFLSADKPGGINLDLIDVTYQAPQDWPAFVVKKDSEKAYLPKAAELIATELGFCRPPISSCDLRVNYYAAPQADWQGKYTTLTSRSLDWSKDKFPGMPEEAYEAVRGQYERELKMITNVLHYFERLKEPFVTSSTASAVDLKALAQELYDNAQIKRAAPSTTWTLGLFGKIIGIGNFASGLTRQVSAGVSASFMLGAYLTAPNGTQVAGRAINTTASQLGRRLADETLDSLAALDAQTLLIISDWGKLKAAYGKVDGDWKLPESNVKAIEDMRTAAGRTVAEGLIPVAVPHLIRTTPGLPNGRNSDCGTIYKFGSKYWFQDVTDASQMWTVDGRYPDGTPYRSYFLMDYVLRSHLPDGVAKSLFLPVTKGTPNLGLEKLSFLSTRLFGRIIHADSGNLYCGLNAEDKLGDAYFRSM